MAKPIMVMCRYCKEKIDRANTVENIDWVKPANNMYYHPSCLQEQEVWSKKKAKDITAEADDEEWFHILYDYLKRDIKISIDFIKFQNQWKNFLKKNMTAKGIYFCAKYFYEIKKGDPSKSEGGIGIIPYIYEEGKNYWHQRNVKDRGVVARIEQQILDAALQEKIIVRKKTQAKFKPKYDLNLIADLEEINDR